MKNYMVNYIRDGESSLVELPSAWKLVWWMLREGVHCSSILVTVTEGIDDLVFDECRPLDTFYV